MGNRSSVERYPNLTVAAGPFEPLPVTGGRACPGSPQEGPARAAQRLHGCKRSGARGRSLWTHLGKPGSREGLLRGVAQIEAGDLAGAEEDAVVAVALQGPHGNAFAMEGIWHAPRLAAEADIALGGADGSQDVAGLVLGLGQLAGHRSRARAVAAGRHIEAEGLVRALVVVDRAPAIEGGLHLGEGAQDFHRQHLGLEGPVEALVLAAGLGMVGPAVQDLDAELEQPHAELGPALRRAIAPGRAIVDQDGVWQAVAPEGPLEMVAHGGALLIAAGLQAKRIARMIIDHRQRMAPTPIRQRKAALEVHLPEQVRGRMFEATMGRRANRRADAVVPNQDRVNRRGRRRHHASGDHTPVTGCGRVPSEKRLKRKGVGSTSGGSPVTRSAASRPAAGPMPKPWPEKPLAMTKPGRRSTGEITGTVSGVASIRPAQLSARLA